MYTINYQICGSETCCNNETLSFDSYVKARRFFDVLVEEDIKSRKTAREYGNYFYSDIGLYSNNRLIVSN